MRFIASLLIGTFMASAALAQSPPQPALWQGTRTANHAAIFGSAAGQNLTDSGTTLGQAASKAVSDNTKGTVASVTGAVTSGNCAQFTDTAGTLGQAAAPCGSGGGGGPATSKNFVTDYGGVGDWVYVAGSSTGTGTVNNTAMTNALNSCSQTGASDIYFPPGNYYINAAIAFGTCDTTLWGPGTIVEGLTAGALLWQPAYGSQQPLAGIIDGWTSNNGAGWVPTDPGSLCEVGDLLTLPGYTGVPRNRRERVIFQVATCSGGGVATLNTINPGIYTSNPGANSGDMITLSGTTTSVSTTNLAWTAPVIVDSSSMRTELVLNGPNSLTDGNQCITLTSDSSTLCVGNKIKIISNQWTVWEYSSGISGTQVVKDTGSLSYGPIVVNGGTGYTNGDTLTIATLTTPITKGAQNGEPTQTGITPATLTVTGVTATGAITSATVNNQGSYKFISYEPLNVTGGTGSGAQFYVTYKSTGSGVGFGEIAAINRIVDATHIVLDRRLYYPHVFDAVNPPIIAKMPSPRLQVRDLSFRSSYNIHNPSFTGRTCGAVVMKGAIQPIFSNVRSEGLGCWFIEEQSVWHGVYDLDVRDGVDSPTQNGYGYGFTSGGGSIGASVKISARGTRHAVTAGSSGFDYGDRATQIARIGASFDLVVHDSVVHGSTASCYDTHEDTFNWSFINDACYYDTPDPNDPFGAPRGVTFRGYGGFLSNFHSYGSTQCISDSASRFPFAGIYGRGSVTTIIGADCKLSEGVSGYADAIVINGPSEIGAPIAWGSTDPLAVTVVENGNYSFCDRVVFSNEEVHKIIIKDVLALNCQSLVTVIGPTDLTLTNNTLDNQNPSYYPSARAVFIRGVSTNFVGPNNIVSSNNTVLPSSNPDGSGQLNPSTIFQDTETNASYFTNLYIANDVEAVNGIATTVATSGAKVNVIDPLDNWRVGAVMRKLTSIGVNLNSAGDTVIPLPVTYTRYRIVGVELTNVSSSLTTATASVWSGAGGTGTNIAPDQSLSALTGTTSQNMGFTLSTASAITDLTSPNLYFRVGTPQGSAVIGDVYIILEEKDN